MPDNIKALRGYIKDRVLYGDSAFFATEDAESCADEIERLREALRGIACTDDTCECGYGEHDGPFCELGRARTALGEDK